MLIAFPLSCFIACKGKVQQKNIKDLYFEVHHGETTSLIASRLKEQNVIDNPAKFKFKAKLKGLDTSLQAGLYLLHTYMDEDSVLMVLASGSVATISVTIPEGLRLEQIAEKLAFAGVVNKDSFLAICKDRKLLDEYHIPFPSFEGILFPDTYKMPVVISEEQVVRLMVMRFFKLAEPYMRHMSLDTLVIMASIVEREAYLDEERPVIASVFFNRLKRKMAFESCATVEYALPEHKERLTYADLRIGSPYNTYLHTGLPPGPICSPGKASLEAVANPEETNYLFFVSKGDGSHYFSETVQEHERMKKIINNHK